MSQAPQCSASELKSTHDPEQEFGVGEAHTVRTISDFITEGRNSEHPPHVVIVDVCVAVRVWVGLMVVVIPFWFLY